MTQQPEKTEQPEEQSPIAQAAVWVSRITTVALEMVLPGILGQYLDERWGTKFLALAGFAIGIIVGIWHLLKMTSQDQTLKEDTARSDATNGIEEVDDQEENSLKDNHH